MLSIAPDTSHEPTLEPWIPSPSMPENEAELPRAQTPTTSGLMTAPETRGVRGLQVWRSGATPDVREGFSSPMERPVLSRREHHDKLWENTRSVLYPKPSLPTSQRLVAPTSRPPTTRPCRKEHCERPELRVSRQSGQFYGSAAHQQQARRSESRAMPVTSRRWPGRIGVEFPD